MKFFNEIKDFLNNSQKEKLFLTVFPSLFVLTLASFEENFNIFIGLLSIISIVLLHLSINILDDYIDWIQNNPLIRQTNEQIGIRINTNKASYYLNYNKNPRHYFYFSILLIGLSLIICFSISHYYKSLFLIFLLLITVFSAILNYTKKFRKAVTIIGTEAIISFLASTVSMSYVYFASTKNLTYNVISLSLIFLFCIQNINYIASILNIKIDTITNKTTFPIYLKKEKSIIYFLLFYALFPYILVNTAININLLNNYAYFTFLLIPHSIWLAYICILHIKFPEKIIKWNKLMGLNKNQIEDEQNNISWYTIKYKLARNIFCIFTFILIVSLLIN